MRRLSAADESFCWLSSFFAILSVSREARFAHKLFLSKYPEYAFDEKKIDKYSKAKTVHVVVVSAANFWNIL